MNIFINKKIDFIGSVDGPPDIIVAYTPYLMYFQVLEANIFYGSLLKRLQYLLKRIFYHKALGL